MLDYTEGQFRTSRGMILEFTWITSIFVYTVQLENILVLVGKFKVHDSEPYMRRWMIQHSIRLRKTMG